MARVLTTEHSPRLGHNTLYERVAYPRLDRDPTIFPDDLGYGLGADQVVKHRGPWVLLKHGFGNYRSRCRAGQRLALVVGLEGPVRHPGERKAGGRALLQDARLQV